MKKHKYLNFSKMNFQHPCVGNFPEKIDMKKQSPATEHKQKQKCIFRTKEKSTRYFSTVPCGFLSLQPIVYCYLPTQKR